VVVDDYVHDGRSGEVRFFGGHLGD
jgi:hypothetical protein